ncbi:hypothetical protein [Thermosipho melanesiensis]|uniref:Uncharacterized protein n=2 Tax=Thermosipho melanesiensis TaxID=46541 RepID=A6LMS9_THEM4|nr:hypothetical protein [Thermosipho melanesiensis]ABR31230.1 hypothetical protein Tmel_1383 [Thermosipho melanesiensis BI429]APT74314.1 hypothetical protein BW47_07325 [Thermosipho melanesiensis]
MVDLDKANIVIDFDKLIVALSNGLSFRLYYSDHTIKEVMKMLFDEKCEYLKENNNFYYVNAYFYKHFTFETSCGITIMILPADYGKLEMFVFRTILDIVKGDYTLFEDEYFVTRANIYKISNNEREFIGRYDPILDSLEIIADEKN